MPSKGEEKDEKENMNSDNTEGDASWKATRSEWVKDGKTNGPLNEEGSISAI